MSTVNDICLMFLLVLTLYSNFVLTIDNSVSLFKKASVSDSGSENNANKNKALNSPIIKPSDVENPETKLESKISEYALEGGGVPQQTSSTLISNINVELEGESHSKGSKGRKGVAHEGSSVVPRKGVDNSEAQSVSNISPGNISLLESPTTSPVKISSKSNSSEVKHNSTNQTTPPHEEVTHQIIQAKKPEVVSDLGDANEFDTYTIIKTSTTGEDYVIIGIVIVIGIWFSVFGALIFYRRAGEYWDRRHYRRMDFLVEGMYND